MSDNVQSAKLGFIHDPKGDQSSIRLVLLSCLMLGSIVILGGLYGWLFMGKQDGATIMAIGSGLISLVSGAKAWQSQAENREVPCVQQNRDL
jgi:hypothetical protein